MSSNKIDKFDLSIMLFMKMFFPLQPCIMNLSLHSFRNKVENLQSVVRVKPKPNFILYHFKALVTNGNIIIVHSGLIKFYLSKFECVKT